MVNLSPKDYLSRLSRAQGARRSHLHRTSSKVSIHWRHRCFSFLANSDDSFFLGLDYTEGLYVLLKPPTKKTKTKKSNFLSLPSIGTTAPPHLKHLEIACTSFPSRKCKWGLSGPQFPTPTAIQQRYCYPRGHPDYANRKGAALWTMYDRDGRESFEFRLLHVYFSLKRALNSGLTLSPAEQALAAEQEGAIDPNTPRRKKRNRNKSAKGTRFSPKRARCQPTDTNLSRSNQGRALQLPETYEKSSATIANFSSTVQSESLQRPHVSPVTASSSSDESEPNAGSSNFTLPFHPVSSCDMRDNDPKPSHRLVPGHNSTHIQPLYSSDRYPTTFGMHENKEGRHPSEDYDLFEDMLLGHPLLDNDSEVENILRRRSTESDESGSLNGSCKTLIDQLEGFSWQIREYIRSRPSSERAPMVCIFSSWANEIAQSPMNSFHLDEETENVCVAVTMAAV